MECPILAACITGRFNERLVLSLASNPACILMDDELNILPTSTHVSNIKPVPEAAAGGSASAADLKDLVESLRETQASLHLYVPGWQTLTFLST